MAKKESENEGEASYEYVDEESSLKAKIIQLHEEHPELSARAIAKRLKTTVAYVSRILSEYKKEVMGPTDSVKEGVIDDMQNLFNIITQAWNATKAKLVVQLFKRRDPDNLKILHNILKMAGCPKSALQFILVSWAEHRQIAPDVVKETFKNDKSILKAFRDMGYFEEMEEEEEEEDSYEVKKKKEEDEDDLQSMLKEMRKQKIQEMRERLEELKMKKQLRELERELGEYETDNFDLGTKDNFDWGPPAPEPIPYTRTRKVIRPAINPATGEILRDDNGNIIFETVEEPIDKYDYGQSDDMQRWIMALAQQKKEDPEKKMLLEKIEKLEKMLEEKEEEKRREQERKELEQRFEQMRSEYMQMYQQIAEAINNIAEKMSDGNKKSFEQELLLTLLQNKDKIPPEVKSIIDGYNRIIEELRSKPQTDEEKQILVKKIEELERKIEEEKQKQMYTEMKTYITSLYKELEILKQQLATKNALSDEKYKMDKIIEMDQARMNTTKEIVKEVKDGFVEPITRLALDYMKEQDKWNRYLMLLQEEERRGLPPGTLTSHLFTAPSVTEKEKEDLLKKIDKAMEI